MFRRPTVPSIDVATASARLAEGGPGGAILIDIRDPGDFRVGRAPGAHLRPVSMLNYTVTEIPKDRTIMVVCWAGNTSQSVVAWMAANGWTDVLSVEGGMDAWRRAGLPLATGDPGADPGF